MEYAGERTDRPAHQRAARRSGIELRERVLCHTPVDRWQNELRVDLLAMPDGEADQPLDDRLVQQMRLQPQLNQARMRDIVVMLLLLHAGILQVLNARLQAEALA